MNESPMPARRLAVLAVVVLATSLPTASAWLASPEPVDAVATTLLVGAAPADPTAMPPAVALWSDPSAAAPPAAPMRMALASDGGHDNVTFVVSPDEHGVRSYRVAFDEMEQDEDGSWRYSFADGEAAPAGTWSVVVTLHEP